MGLIRKSMEKLRDEGLLSFLAAAKRYVLNKTPHPKLVLHRVRQGTWTITRKIDGYKMKLNAHPERRTDIERELVLTGSWEPTVTEIFKKDLKDIKGQFDNQVYVFDIGANIGYYALLESAILGDQGEILAVEPDQNNAESLRENIEINSFTNIEIIKAAAGSKQTRKNLHLQKEGNSIYHFFKEGSEERTHERVEEVDVIPIDVLIQQHSIPNNELVIVRMDIEGFEDQAFNGMTDFLASNRPAYVFVEIHPRDHNPGEYIIDLLERNGFKPEFAFTGSTNAQIPHKNFEDIIENKPDTGYHIFASRGVTT